MIIKEAYHDITLKIATNHQLLYRIIPLYFLIHGSLA